MLPSQTAEYALRAVVWLAQQNGESLTAQQVAEDTRMPSSYLSKVLHGLTRAGIVSSQRGPYGGFALAADDSKLTLLDVINAVDPIRRISECPMGNAEDGSHLCPLHQALDHTAALVEESLSQTTIRDLLTNPTPTKPVCPEPAGLFEKPAS